MSLNFSIMKAEDLVRYFKPITENELVLYKALVELIEDLGTVDHDEINDLKIDVDRLQSEIDDYEIDIDRLQSEINDLKNEINTLENNHEVAINTLENDHEDAIVDYEARIKKLGG